MEASLPLLKAGDSTVKDLAMILDYTKTPTPDLDNLPMICGEQLDW